ncbi:MAG: outer membrane beta-barrel protein [Saprospiraceae bacterium]|nr:outer membrane beta-barrel protein [Saprospiraceae bacterium]
MKICTLCMIIILVDLVNCAYGQSIIGITGGYNRSTYFDRSTTLPTHYGAQYNSQPTFCFSVFLKPRNKKYFTVGSQISFINKVLNLKASYGGLGFQTIRDDHIHANYLYFSLLPELSLGKKFAFNLNFGPSIGTLINSRRRGISYETFHGNRIYWPSESSANNDFNTLDLRIYLNIGIEIPLRDKFKLVVNNSYSRGIINSADGGLGNYGCFINTNDVSLNIGLIYKLEKFAFSLLPKTGKKFNNQKD